MDEAAWTQVVRKHADEDSDQQRGSKPVFGQKSHMSPALHCFRESERKIGGSLFQKLNIVASIDGRKDSARKDFWRKERRIVLLDCSNEEQLNDLALVESSH